MSKKWEAVKSNGIQRLYSYISVLVVLQVKLHQASNADNVDLKSTLEPFLRDSLVRTVLHTNPLR